MYESADTELQVSFYSTALNERGRMLKYFLSTEIIHCSIMLTRENRSLILAADTTHFAKFVPSHYIHRNIMKPDTIVDLGTRRISIQQVQDFVGSKYIGDVPSAIFWWYIGRHTFKSLLPKTCGLITSQILRMCGYKVDDHVLPHTLLEELKHDYDTYRWQSWCWKNNLCSDGSKRSI